MNQPSTLDHVDRAVDGLATFAGHTVTKVTDRLARVVGHPVHPMMTDLPIGFWTSAVALDCLRRSPKASRRLLALGIASAVPTVLTGLGDLPGLPKRRRRLAAIHLAANTVAIGCFAASWLRRRRDVRRGRVWSGLGTVAATVGGWVGGRMAFGDGER